MPPSFETAPEALYVTAVEWIYSDLHPAVWAARADRLESDETGLSTDVALDMDATCTDARILNTIERKIRRNVRAVRAYDRTGESFPSYRGWISDDAAAAFGEPPEMQVGDGDGDV